MSLPPKSQWRVTASSGDSRYAVDDLYATAWTPATSGNLWLEIDFMEMATIGGIEVYWGKLPLEKYAFESSRDGQSWSPLCRTRHGEGGQDVFAFPPTKARVVRLHSEEPSPSGGIEVVEINFYAPDKAASILEKGRFDALGRGPVKILTGESITVDFGYVRSPLGALIDWGETYGTIFSAYLSDDGESFRQVGRIETGDGGVDSFWWRSTTSRYFRLTVHKANSPEGAVVNELKLRILNKDRMPIGQLERAALAGRGDLYPQSLLGRQVYWTAIGESSQAEEALFDEYGALEPRRNGPQIGPLLRLNGSLYGAPGCASVSQSLIGGSLPIPSVDFSARGVDVRVTALAHSGQALAEYRVTNQSAAPRDGALILAVRPVQINPYWQHGGHAAISAIAVERDQLLVNDLIYAAFSRDPDVVTIADFDQGDVARIIEKEPRQTARLLRSGSGLLSAACEFRFLLAPGESMAVVLSASMRDDVTPQANVAFAEIQGDVANAWRDKIGQRRIVVGDRDVSETLETQIPLILINATRTAFKPGPRNYDRTWIRDGSAQALALLWAGLANEAKNYILWYSERIYKTGLVPPILNPDGAVNHGYGGDIEYDAQGEFVGIAAEIYRVTKDRTFLNAIFEPAVRATKFIDELCARNDALHGSDTRFHGLLAPSISHEGYSKPSYSYWDNYFALSAWRNCEYLAREFGDQEIAAHAKTQGEAFAAKLTRSIRMTAAAMERDMIPGSADREDVDPTSTSIAFEPCRVEDALPPELIGATYDRAAARIKAISSPSFQGNYSPYDLRNINPLVSLSRFEDAFQLLSVMLNSRRPRAWRIWAEVVWSDLRTPEYLGDMPHTWIGAEFFTAIRRMLLREKDSALELFRAVPDAWWDGPGITLDKLPTSFGAVSLKARRGRSQAIVELAIAGPSPELITFRYPGVKRALADGKSCEIREDVILAPSLRQLLIDF
jgi:hypothetical protein